MRARALAGAAVAALITLVTAEVALRLSFLIPVSIPSSPFIPDDELGFKLRPSGLTDADGFNNPRSEETPAPARIAAPNTIVFVGDSFAFGTYPADAVFPALVATDLGSEGIAARAVNLGIPAAGPDIYVRAMRSYLPRLQPAAVVTTIYLGNDVGQSDPRRPTTLWFGQTINDGASFSLDPDDFVITRMVSRLWRLASEFLASRAAQGPVTPDPAEADRSSSPFSQTTLDRVRWQELNVARIRPDASIARGYDGLEKHLEQMAAIARQNDVKFLVVLAPSRAAIDPELRTHVIAAFDADPGDFDGGLPARRVGDALTARGIPFIDLTAALVAAGPERVYNRGDTHWNRRGNAVAAEAIAVALKPMLATP